MISETIGNSVLYYTNEYQNGNLSEYYEFVLNKLKTYIISKDISKSICFGIFNETCDIKLDFQYEQSILNFNGVLMSSIHRKEYLNKFDYVFEYSLPNVLHYKKFNENDRISHTAIYFPPLYHEIINFAERKRNKNVVAIHTMNERRSVLYQKGCYDLFFGTFERQKIIEVLNEYKILLNIHQNEVSKTFEESRCLSALLSGIVVISEDVVYRDDIPYSKHIIWCEYDKIENTINDTLNNYEEIKNLLFKDLDITISVLQNKITEGLDKIFLK